MLTRKGFLVCFVFFLFLFFFFPLPHCGAATVGESGASLPLAAEKQHVVLRGSSRAALNRL